MDRVRVKHFMTEKVITLFAEQTLPLASDLMELRHVRHLPVVDEDGRLKGLVTHRDVLAAQVSVLTGLSTGQRDRLQAEVKVADVMRTDAITVGPETPAVDAAQIMIDLKIGCLPVVGGDDKLVGIVTEADFLDFAIKVLKRDAR
jgi:CBS domain-containing protein